MGLAHFCVQFRHIKSFFCVREPRLFHLSSSDHLHLQCISKGRSEGRKEEERRRRQVGKLQAGEDQWLSEYLAPRSMAITIWFTFVIQFWFCQFPAWYDSAIHPCPILFVKGPFVSRGTVAWNHSYPVCLHNLYKFWSPGLIPGGILSNRTWPQGIYDLTRRLGGIWSFVDFRIEWSMMFVWLFWMGWVNIVVCLVGPDLDGVGEFSVSLIG